MESLGFRECHESNTVQEKELPDGSYAEIIVIRHGETDWNALGKIQGQTDNDLNEVGRKQAYATAERLFREPNIVAVYTSDLKRALETAEIIAARCNGIKVIQDLDLRERHKGELEGLVYNDLPWTNPEGLEALRSHDLDQEIPGGGESHLQLYKRCTSSIQRIGEKHRGQRVIVVTHGAVMETLYERAVPEGERKFGGIANAAMGVIHLSDGEMWSIKSWNDTSHLNNTGYLESAFGADGSSC